MTAALAAQDPWWQPGTRHGDHVFSFGWLVGELVRRITGQRLGSYLRQEVAGPLGLDCHIGLPATCDARTAEFLPVPPPPPGGLGFEEQLLRRAGPMTHQALSNPPHTVADINTGAWRAAEIPGRERPPHRPRAGPGVRRPGQRGAGGPHQVLSPESIARARTEQANGPDAVRFGWPTRFGLGLVLPPQGAGFGSASATAFGHPGDGGSIGFADPNAQVGFGYVVNQLHAGMPPDPRALRLIQALHGAL